MQAGELVGHYRLTGLLGQGGMGAVYTAEHTVLGRPAAVKVLLPELSQNQDIVARFFTEARAATSVRHPGIVEIYDFGWHNGTAYIVMERLEGESLAARMARERMSWNQGLVIARQIAGVLAATHAKGIIHRDLKPDNVFLEPDPEVPGGERVKLLDFGIAKLIDDSGAQRRTHTGAVIGTPSYMAPEQCRGVTVDPRADLYSLGCIMFEIYTGRPPFLGEGAGDVLAAHIHVPAPTMASLVPGIPAPIEQLVQRLLAKQPQDRAQAASEIIIDIDSVMNSMYQSGIRPIAAARPAHTAALASTTTLSGAVGTATLLVRGNRRQYYKALGVATLISLALAIYFVTSGAQENLPTVQPSRDVSQPILKPPAAPPVSAQASPTPTQILPTTNQVHSAPRMEPPGVIKTAPSPPPLPPPQTIEVAIDSTPPGADILWSGRVLGQTPFQGKLPRGERAMTMVVRLRGYVDKIIVVRPNKPSTQNISLVASPKLQLPLNPDDSVNPFDPGHEGN